MAYKKGDIVLLEFPFSSGSNSKLRPGLIWDNYLNDYSIMLISSNISNISKNCILIHKDNFNNLKSDSKVKVRHIYTVSMNLIVGKSGYLNSCDLHSINNLFCSIHCSY